MAPSSAADLLLFALTSAAAVFLQRKTTNAVPDEKTCSSSSLSPSSATPPSLLNSAFVFVKPHANTPATRDMVRQKLLGAGLSISSETDISGTTIDENKLVDKHYYAIASKATMIPAKNIPVPTDMFESEFGEKWDAVLNDDRACNAMEACAKFGCDADTLTEAWRKSDKVVKFGGGFYCGLVSVDGKGPLYVFNAFFMTMRSAFVGEGKSIHCYVVEWDPKVLSWKEFRGTLIGPTDPAEAPVVSVRRTILDKYKELGLTSEPNKGDNGVHASASPFEGLAEKTNWLGLTIEEDDFGKALLNAGVPKDVIEEWSLDPRVELPPSGGMGSVFDALEDLDAEECLARVVEMHEFNADHI